MGERFSIHQLLYSASGSGASKAEAARTDEYTGVMEAIRASIVENYANELFMALYEEGKEKKLRQLITRHITGAHLKATGIESIAQLSDMIYDDMAGFGPVTPYLKDPDVEEININGFDKIYVCYPDRKIRIDRHFASPEECAETVRRMARNGGIILDGSKPFGDSFIARGIRMSGVVPPCVDSAIGAIASIRKQKPSVVTREKILEWNTATAEELDFLTLCINCGVSVAFVGDTGSGKTSDLNLLVDSVSGSRRKFVIEDTREAFFDSLDHDAVFMLTKEQSPPVTMQDGLRLALRFDPDIIVPSEMRGAEAYTAVEAGRTGHTIVSTLHAGSALSAYDRILTMCLQSGTTLSESRLLANIVEALPVIVYKSRLPDNSRKFMEIFEATGVQDGKVVGEYIFNFEVSGHERDKDGEVIRTNGAHRQVGRISEKLARRMLTRGADSAQLAPYVR
ncbi:MAG: Flp pilus assembly complex ATPase component TadA [Oscillospiraceae bacterium]|jgi:pilus assembly protein CpaF|nr:Flp pilus assembly complex ATPase component TadA [Oscillospiraceae bacterium]